ncbi:MAG: hypothetical protein IPJ06_04390 [Saprospiraceae bacterium]|nr:hypothetical protein [Saprospiraceae bacterium]
MYRLYTFFSVLVILTALVTPAFSQTPSDFWTLRDPGWVNAQGDNPWVQPAHCTYASLDLDALRIALPQGGNAIIFLPAPTGERIAFRATWSPAAEPGYFARHPETGTFKVIGIEDPTCTGRIDYTVKGFHAMIRQDGRTWMIDPVFLQKSDVHAAYYLDEYWADPADAISFTCHLDEGSLASTRRNQFRCHPHRLFAAGPYP